LEVLKKEDDVTVSLSQVSPLVGQPGRNLSEDSTEARLPRHRVVVLDEVAQTVVEDLTESLEVFELYSLTVRPFLGHVIEGSFKSFGIIEQSDDVVKSEEDTERVDGEATAFWMLDINGRHSFLDLRVLLCQLENSKTSESNLQLR